jgi:hypothetical protein
MSFGLRNAAQQFRRFMDDTLRELDFCFAYLDDILTFSRSLKEHKQHLRTLFDRLKKRTILINPIRCVFKASKIAFIRYKVSAEGSQLLEEPSGPPSGLPSFQDHQSAMSLLGNSWECSIFTDDFCRKPLLLRHHSMMFSPAPESKALIPLPGCRNSTRPSKSARQACHMQRYWRTPNYPCNLHSSQMPPLLPWVPYYNNLSTTPGSLSHSFPRNSTQHSRDTAHTIENS